MMRRDQLVLPRGAEDRLKEDPASALEGRRKRERDAHVRRGVQALPVEDAFTDRTLESGVGDQDLLGEGGAVVRGA